MTSASATHGSEEEMEQTQREEGWSSRSFLNSLSSCIQGEQWTAPADVHASQLCSEDMGAGVSVPGVTRFTQLSSEEMLSFPLP